MVDDDHNEHRLGPFMTDDLPVDGSRGPSGIAEASAGGSDPSRADAKRTGQLDVELGALSSDGAGTTTTPRSSSTGVDVNISEGSGDAKKYVMPAEGGSVSISGGDADISKWAPSLPPNVPVRSDAPRSSATISPAPAVGHAGGRSTAAATGTSYGQSIAVRRSIDTTGSVLNADQYAAVVADALEQTRDEVCFALFGEWGRGKTHLAKLIQQKLADRHEAVWFSAWKYRTRPELWVFLYETFRERLSSDGWRVALPRAFRAGVARHGIWGVHAFLFGFGLSLFPLAYFTYFLISALGLLTVLRVVMVYRRQREAARHLSQRYLRHASHADKLGLQGALAADLRALVVGAFHPVKIKSRWLAIGLYALLVLFVLTAGYFAFRGPSVVQVPWLDDLRWTLPRDPLIVAGVALVVGSIIVPLWLLRYGTSSGVNARRLLLVVDDLDRTSDDEALEIVESLKLFLEEDGIAEKLQVLILCQEDTLSRAISRKYHLHPLDVREIDDAMQKLFMGHLRLSSLDNAQLGEIFDHLMKHFGVERGEVKSSPAPSDATLGASAWRERVSNWLQRVWKRLQRKDKPTRRSGAPVRFTRDEADALEKALRLAVTAGARPPGPRAIQCYMFRYTLARQLLSAMRAMPDPNDVARPLARATFQGDRDFRDLPAPLRGVLAEVA